MLVFIVFRCGRACSSVEPPSPNLVPAEATPSPHVVRVSHNLFEKREKRKAMGVAEVQIFYRHRTTYP